MRQSLRTLSLAVVTFLAVSATASAQHHGHGHHHNGGWGGGGGWGGNGGFYNRGWGSSFGSGAYGFGRVGPFLPFSSGYGYSSFGGFGGLSYYNGPVGGFGPMGYGSPYGYGGGFGGFGGGYGYTSFGYPNFGPYYSYTPMAPIVVQTRPLFIGPDPADNPVIQEWMPQFQGQKQQGQKQNAAAGQPAQADVKLFIKPSSPEAKRKSIRSQAQGDEWFVKQNYLQAFARYKQATAAAADRPEPRFRLALSLAAMGEYGQAVDEIKRLVRLDPEWPAHGDRLDEVFGADNSLSKNAMLLKVADWVREDIRDPERLYLLGVLLHFNEDQDKAKTLFQTTNQLAGDSQHVSVFLAPAGPALPIAPAKDPAALPEEEAEDELPVPNPQARPAAKKAATELAGPRLPGRRAPLDAQRDDR
ncbi:MAG: tetratricopeptide repeat protein [Planctomycetaceae bacterium]|nr:tetratricopeptide repeat protein [Planctomycetaceae bacterium]